MLPVHEIRALLFVIHFYTSNDEAITHELNQVIINGQVHPNALWNLEELMIQRQRHDLRRIMQQTLRGKIGYCVVDNLVTSSTKICTYFNFHLFSLLIQIFSVINKQRSLGTSTFSGVIAPIRKLPP